ncbi:N-acetylneuraminate synthase [Insolitispirillum peregrinum]|uniref:N-acetylneuraminate synthase n=1 Tax=Insolitispirillum peregrinum TaxID=80876 RepID=UPI003608EEE9
MSVYIIAEAGVNHNGSLEMACELVDRAADAGSDAVKFQTFRASALVTRTARKADYQIANMAGAAESDSQHAMLKALELDEAAHHTLLAHCQRRGIAFLSTPFDEDSVDLLVRLGVDRLKIPSGELTNASLVLKVARSGLPVILSTGMATLPEIDEALGVLAFGLLGLEQPGRAAFAAARHHPDAARLLAERVILLHCTTEYPAPLNEVNLHAMATLRQHCGVPVGYSDHTAGISVPVAAAALGACLIEKHFTLDRSLPGPDHRASLEPAELTTMVQMIRDVSIALGQPEKAPTPSEVRNARVARRSLVALRPIAKGGIFTADALAARRPGTGRSPMDYFDLLGTPACRDYAPDDLIDGGDLS